MADAETWCAECGETTTNGRWVTPTDYACFDCWPQSRSERWDADARAFAAARHELWLEVSKPLVPVLEWIQRRLSDRGKE